MNLGIFPAIIGAVTALAPLATSLVAKKTGGAGSQILANANAAWQQQQALEQQRLALEQQKLAAQEAEAASARRFKYGVGLAACAVAVGVVIYVRRKKRR